MNIVLIYSIYYIQYKSYVNEMNCKSFTVKLLQTTKYYIIIIIIIINRIKIVNIVNK